jgi:predicted helicase
MNEAEYEHSVAKYLVYKNPQFKIKYNYKIVGKYSKAMRQIDVYVESNIGKITIVECKYYNRKVDVKIIDSFIGFLEDIDADSGLLITNKGASKTAKLRILEKDIHIVILDDDAF